MGTSPGLGLARAPRAAGAASLVTVEFAEPDPQLLLELVRARMPFGKYTGRPLYALPEAYLVWFAQKGFPSGELGMQLRSMYEIRANGLGGMLDPLIAAARRR